jgi:hypothetical protein
MQLRPILLCSARVQVTHLLVHSTRIRTVPSALDSIASRVRRFPVLRSTFATSVARFSLPADEMATVNTSDRLTRLRELMKSRKVDVYSMIVLIYLGAWSMIR